jgi:hypothetical protein
MKAKGTENRISLVAHPYCAPVAYFVPAKRIRFRHCSAPGGHCAAALTRVPAPRTRSANAFPRRAFFLAGGGEGGGSGGEREGGWRRISRAH